MNSSLALDVKRLIVQSCQKEADPTSISDEEPLFGSDTRLALDSLDALQVSMAIQKRWGLRLTDSKETRRVLASVGTLVQALERHLAKP
ncbi:MAG: acyl carrier protein [Firmicutes bacterium]|nr:acyl carrier protein [Bacillota bacterium]